jgi:opacity protein-like surface antigen
LFSRFFVKKIISIVRVVFFSVNHTMPIMRGIRMKSALFALVLSCSHLFATQGFYVGGSLGGHLAQGNQLGNALGLYNFGDEEGTGSYPVDLKQQMWDHGVQGMLYGGYGARWRSLYLGAEGFVQFGFAHFQNSQQGGLYTLEIENPSIPSNFVISSHTDAHIKSFQYGLDLLPGWSPTLATLLYGRIGVSAARLTLSQESVNFGNNAGDIFNLSLPFSKKKTIAALRAGGGIEQRLTQRLALRADYIFTDYGRLSVQGLSSGTSPFGDPISVQSDTTLHLYDHAVMLGLSYHFSCLAPLSLEPESECAALAYRGCYLGGSIGGGCLEGRQKGIAVGTNSAFGDTTQTTKPPAQLYNNQFQGMLFLGYGRQWKWLYLGGELVMTAASHRTLAQLRETIYTNISPLASIQYTDTLATSIRTSTWQYGGDLRPGILLTPLTLLYGRIGCAATWIKTHSDAQYTGQFPGFDWHIVEGSSSSLTRAVLRLGIGIEQFLTPKLHLRADYIYNNFGKISTNGTGRGKDTSGDTVILVNTLTSRLRSNAVILGLSYYFR